MNNVIYVVGRIAYDGWSCTGTYTEKLLCSFQTKEEAEAWVSKQPKDDGDGSGWYRYSYIYEIQPCGFGADYGEGSDTTGTILADDEEDEEEE